MCSCAIKFCGGCNPRYERGKALDQIRTALSDLATFSSPEDGKHYPLLLIIRGCTGCPYLYEEIDADARVVLTALDEMPAVLQTIRNILSQTEK